MFKQLREHEEKLLIYLIDYANEKKTNQPGLSEEKMGSIDGYTIAQVKTNLVGLQENGMIKISWFMGGSCSISFTVDGLNYFIDKENFLRERNEERNALTRREIRMMGYNAIIAAVVATIFSNLNFIGGILMNIADVIGRAFNN